MSKIPEITVHGRFQPPLHVNHWMYVKQGFALAEHVTVLITNPDLNEANEATSSWRNAPESNPFTFAERLEMFTRFFMELGIGTNTYRFKPFNITDEAAFADLDPTVPNLVNVYSEWSAKKEQLFKGHGLPVTILVNPETNPVSGTLIRRIISETTDITLLPQELTAAGFMPQAVPGLLAILEARRAISTTK